MLIGHYTNYIGPIVKKPENSYVARNVQEIDYVAGGSVEYYDPRTPVDINNIFKNGVAAKDLFAVILPFGWIPDENFVDITGNPIGFYFSRILSTYSCFIKVFFPKDCSVQLIMVETRPSSCILLQSAIHSNGSGHTVHTTWKSSKSAHSMPRITTTHAVSRALNTSTPSTTTPSITTEAA